MAESRDEPRNSKISQDSYLRIRNMLKINIARASACSDAKYSRGHSISFDPTTTQWELLVKKFSKDSKAHERQCLTTINPEEITCELQPPRVFPTGSHYTGTWDIFGMSGYGKYTYPNGVIYEGEFEDNMLHGDGELQYPNGIILKGRWNHGELLERTIILDDCVHYTDKDWTYCKSPDRRFVNEFFEGLQAGGAEYMTAEDPPRDIPEGMYDVGDGFYDPDKNAVFRYNNLTSIVRCPKKDIQNWIQANCRTNPYTQNGPLPDDINHIDQVKLVPEAEPSPDCLSEASMDYSNPNMPPTSTSSVWRHKASDTSPWCKRNIFEYDPNMDRSDKPRARQSRTSQYSRRFTIDSQINI